MAPSPDSGLEPHVASMSNGIGHSAQTGTRDRSVTVEDAPEQARTTKVVDEDQRIPIKEPSLRVGNNGSGSRVRSRERSIGRSTPVDPDREPLLMRFDEIEEDEGIRRYEDGDGDGDVEEERGGGERNGDVIGTGQNGGSRAIHNPEYSASSSSQPSPPVLGPSINTGPVATSCSTPPQTTDPNTNVENDQILPDTITEIAVPERQRAAYSSSSSASGGTGMASSRTENQNQNQNSIQSHSARTQTQYPSIGGSGSGDSHPGAARNLPLLSSRAPLVESDSCRTCGKVFFPLFRKPHTCASCGYQYCDTHCDEQALVPKKMRTRGGSGAGGPDRAQVEALMGDKSGVVTGGGWELAEVCGNCFPLLQITSGQLPYLRSLPLKRLQQYTKAYGLSTSHAIEKEDFVQTIVKARAGPYGCLPPQAESYYRRRSVPIQGVLPTESKSSTNANGGASDNVNAGGGRARPGTGGGIGSPWSDITSNPVNGVERAFNNVSNMFKEAFDPGASSSASGSTQRQQAQQQSERTQRSAYPPHQPQPRYQPRPPQSQTRPQPAPAPRPQYRPPQPQPRPPRAQPPTSSSNRPSSTASRPTTTSARPNAPPPPVPSILSLIALPTSYISTLSIGTLKAILYENHVKVDFSQILEKGELVRRVAELVKEERKRLERQAKAEEEEEAAAAAAVAAGNKPKPPTTSIASDQHDKNGSSGGVEDEGKANGSLEGSAVADVKPHVPTGPQATPERDGLCVICQDAEAQLAVVDCGHLSMCADCSKLVMATSRECPLCRTRIVTEQRLIRIFRT